MCLWPKVRIRVCQNLRRVSVNHSFSHFRRTERRTLRSSDEPLARWERRFDGRHTGGFDVHEGMCATCCMCDTCMAKPPCFGSCDVWNSRVNVWMCVVHVSSAGTSVEGNSCLSVTFGFPCLSFRVFLQYFWSWTCVRMTNIVYNLVGAW